ncbi:Dynamin superfamily [Trypanosoma melophagium]|uniref:Dynamin superfamily n=1 Tax=Trypanosoma melophagium TaxID=715481 RepID=UPI00351AA3BC|nr:Dynamin superfamily [Trypanosoma melophagium]
MSLWKDVAGSGALLRARFIQSRPAVVAAAAVSGSILSSSSPSLSVKLAGGPSPGIVRNSRLYCRRTLLVPAYAYGSCRGVFTVTTTIKSGKSFGWVKQQVEKKVNNGGQGAMEAETREDEGLVGWESDVDERKALRSIEIAISSLKNDSLRQYDDTFNFLPAANYRHSMVMLLGNHSAGKSTIINYLLGREVQRTGVAPTDDGFTIIQRGNEDNDDDGPTGVSDPRYQLQDLQKFGLHFVHRFKIKTRRLPNLSRVPPGLMIVDTPGMIDTPIHVRDRTSLEGQLRGYDFLAVTRWFASRCDVILLVFDPANPGTTGETLDVLTRSLAGFEHKFLLVMNKVDVFDKTTDFARAYGALCWNLSKVLTMKDIPRIYTTFVPTKASVASAATSNSTSTTSSAGVDDKARVPLSPAKPSPISPLSEEGAKMVAMEEFVRQREEVVDEILKAPLRRLDNLITEAEEGARRILLAGRVCTAIVWDYRRWQLIGVLAPTALFGVAGGILALGGLSKTPITLATLTALVGAATLYAAATGLKRLERELLEHSDAVVDRIFIGRENTLDLQLRWKNAVKPEILNLAETSAAAGRGVVASLPTLTPWGRKVITSVLTRDIPALRLRVAEYKQKLQSKVSKPSSSSSSSLPPPVPPF